MKERPILFSGEMVRAILEGRKTMTRRIVKEKAFDMTGLSSEKQATFEKSARASVYWDGFVRSCPYGQPGDWLWVRETWGVGTRPDPNDGWRDGIEYRADQAYLDEIEDLPLYSVEPAHDLELAKYESEGWRPSIHMPRWASRILLEVVSVRVERVQDISEEDALKEGITGPHAVGYPAYWCPGDSKARYSCATAAFESLWDSINAERGYGWGANPWVWVIEFKRVEVER